MSPYGNADRRAYAAESSSVDSLNDASGVTMKEISRILAVVDPTASEQPAMHRAAWLAKKNGAELELLVCYYNEYLSGDRLFDSPSLEKARDEVIQSHENHRVS
jgi:nucleotide-binding universal stress UspA family protein